jgi:hypothetical protein
MFEFLHPHPGLQIYIPDRTAVMGPSASGLNGARIRAREKRRVARDEWRRVEVEWGCDGSDGLCGRKEGRKEGKGCGRNWDVMGSGKI